ncbi:MAG TPA: helix-turn-helix domain-containing protein [Gemmataceae bacterium]|nr:helix-turn-helix domain-containing protein [Gemmataceae bacterium]
MGLTSTRSTFIAPTKKDANRAAESLTFLRSVLSRARLQNKPLQFQAVIGPNGAAEKAVPIPVQVIPLLMDLLQHLASGKAVTLVPHDVELTTQEAAALLNVSRPYLIGLLEARKIPCRMVGKHRRIKADDLFRYKKQEEEERAKVLAELAEDAQKLGMGY